ncbi:MAG: hypothetical protein QOF09_4786 [Alphaproteobacteria bacterium]|jgi:hypothetical protein|nr:hypothetical protein [Alphaproteobacteria bacterium]
MRGMIVGIGMVAIVGMAIVQPVSAEEVYVSGGRDGISVGVDGGYRHRDRDRYVERRVIHHRAFARGECRTTIIKRDGFVKKIRRCD